MVVLSGALSGLLLSDAAAFCDTLGSELCTGGFTSEKNRDTMLEENLLHLRVKHEKRKHTKYQPRHSDAWVNTHDPTAHLFMVTLSI